MPANVRSELAPNGVLRAGINLGNPLLVTGETPTGDPQGEPVGVAPDMARAIADRLDVRLSTVPYASPGALADAAEADAWDIGLIAIEPKRAETIAFTPAYVEIEATYLVPAGSPIQSIDDVDRPGVRIAVSGRSAYDLFLSRTVAQAELVRGEGLAATFDLFVAEQLDVLAGLRPGLMENAETLSGARILDGQFMAVQQAIGTQREKQAAGAFLRDFVAEAKASGLVAALIERHGATGRLLVAK
jgi:polar amino acid transport system substrate-binding protein